MSALEAALANIYKRGWLLQGLGKGPFNSIRPWSCELIPNLTGKYEWGTPTKEGGYTVYPNAMARVIGEGGTALEAVEAALDALDISEAAELYMDLQRAVEEAVNVRLEKARNRGREQDSKAGRKARL